MPSTIFATLIDSPVLIALLVSGTLLTGCQRSGHPQTVAVTGTVTFTGQPVAGADVVFLPQQGQISTGQTDVQGRFQLMTFKPGDGAAPGAYTVAISKKEQVIDPKNPQNPYPLVRDVLPERYGTPQRSGLSAKVEATQRNDFAFDLQP